MARASNEDSMAGQIRALAPGQSFSRTTRIDLKDKQRSTTADALAKLRNLVNQAVGRVRTASGSNFRVESTVGVTDDKLALLATVAATRMDDGDDEESDI